MINSKRLLPASNTILEVRKTNNGFAVFNGKIQVTSTQESETFAYYDLIDMINDENGIRLIAKSEQSSL